MNPKNLARENFLSLSGILLSSEPMDARVHASLLEVKKFLTKTDPAVFFDAIFHNASAEAKRKINSLVQGLDHVGFIAPGGLEISLLERVSVQCGFSQQHKVFPSQILAKELGSLVGSTRVPTKIFECASRSANGHQTVLGAEFFLPEAPPQTVEEWIRQGVGTHVAILVKNRPAVEEVKKLLLSEGYSMAAFMEGQAMENSADGTTTAYFDVATPQSRFRVEFFHRDSAELK